MENEQQVHNWHQTDERFISTLKELETINENYVVSKIKSYKGLSTQARLRFRISGAMIIALSVCLPFLTTLKTGIWISIIVPLMIAGLSGFNAFFQWESNWKGFSQTSTHLNIYLRCGN